MTISFPASLDTLPQPTATTTEDQAGFEHDVVHTNLALAVMALEAKVGATSSAVATSLDYLIAHLAAIANSGSGADLSAGTVTLAKVATQADATLLGNNTGGVASPVALTAVQARTLLGLLIGTNVQAWDATLDALAGLDSGTGFVAETASDTFAKRTWASGIGTSVNNPAGVAGNPSTDVLMLRGMFGDATDGTVDPGSVTLAASKAYGSITLAGTVAMGGYEICCSGTLTVNGTVHANGNNGGNASGTNQATGGALGSATTTGQYGGGQAGTVGASGGTGAGAQASGNASGSIFNAGTSGSGGASGLGSGGAGVSTKTATATTAREARRVWFDGRLLGGTSLLNAAPGGVGGGSGGGDATNAGGGGGGGGSGGGYAVLRAKAIVIGAAGVVSANGANGGNGGSPTTTTGGCGGGGGGGGGTGGVVLLVYESLTITAGGVVTASAGTHGTKGTKTGTGVDGANGGDGSAGIVLKFNLTTGAFE